MTLEEKILMMYYDENLTVGEIAGALHQDPKYVFAVIFRK